MEKTIQAASKLTVAVQIACCASSSRSRFLYVSGNHFLSLKVHSNPRGLALGLVDKLHCTAVLE